MFKKPVSAIMITTFAMFWCCDAAAAGIQLYCEGRLEFEGVKQKATDSVVVTIDKESTRIKVLWGEVTSIDEVMVVTPNLYAFREIGNKRMKRLIEVNRSTLGFTFMHDTGKGMWLVKGKCAKFEPRI